MENVYAAANVALLTSDNEGMPVTLIEAALSGVPAVTTNVGSAGEVVLNGVTGFTVAPDAACLVEAVRGLLANEIQCREIGLSARKWAEENFSVGKMTSAHMDLYESVMADPPKRRFRSKLKR